MHRRNVNTQYCSNAPHQRPCSRNNSSQNSNCFQFQRDVCSPVKCQQSNGSRTPATRIYSPPLSQLTSALLRTMVGGPPSSLTASWAAANQRPPTGPSSIVHTLRAGDGHKHLVDWTQRAPIPVPPRSSVNMAFPVVTSPGIYQCIFVFRCRQTSPGA